MGNNKDLLVLVADGDAVQMFEGLLRHFKDKEKLNFSFDIIKHPQHDPGVMNNASKIVRLFICKYRYIIAELDYEGCGKEKSKTVEQVEEMVFNNLSANGWAGRCAVIAINPELEQWLWGPSPLHLQSAIDWEFEETIYEFAESNGFLLRGQQKPERPKEAFESIRKQARFQTSSSVFKNFASKASYKRCTDRAFLKLKKRLIDWFGEKP